MVIVGELTYTIIYYGMYKKGPWQNNHCTADKTAIGWYNQENEYLIIKHIETTWSYLFIVSLSTSCVLSAWQDSAAETEDPKDPLVSSLSFWHWLLDICHHLILYYSINNPPFIFITGP